MQTYICAIVLCIYFHASLIAEFKNSNKKNPLYWFAFSSSLLETQALQFRAQLWDGETSHASAKLISSFHLEASQKVKIDSV